jgi:hypothetical protein
MLKIDEETLDRMEELYPGIRETILRFENATLQACSHCGSENAADVQIGIIGRTIHIAAATTKFVVIPNAPKPGKYFCYTCKSYFD